MAVIFSPDSPKILIEAYVKTKGLGHFSGGLVVYHDILFSIIEDSKQNKYLWNKLKPFIEKNEHFHDDGSAYLSLYNTIELAIAGVSSWESYTKGERKERCKDIAKKARELAKLLKRTPFDEALLAEFKYSHYALNSYNFGDEEKEHLESLMESSYITNNVDDKIRHGEVTNEHRETLETMGLFAPYFSEALLGLASKADDRSKNTNEIVNKKSGSPQRVYFIRRISDWFNWYCNDPLHTYTAELVNRIFDEHPYISSQEVRDALKNHTHTKPPTDTQKIRTARCLKYFNKD